MRDHPKLSFWTLQELAAARAAKENPAVLRDRFTKLQEIIQKHSLTAERIWNMDESGFNIGGRLKKVLAQKNSRQVHKIPAGNSRDHVSVCPTISAAKDWKEAQKKKQASQIHPNKEGRNVTRK